MSRTRLALIALVLAGCGAAPQPGAMRRTADAPSAAATTGRWFAVQLHAHSRHSDGRLSIAEMIAEAKAAGLDALGVSDHETTMHWLDPAFTAERELLMLRSEEACDTRDHNHMGLHGFTGMTPIMPKSRDEVLAEARARGATVVLNHPFNRLLPWSPRTLDPRVHAIEVWNAWYWTPLEETDERRTLRLQNDQAIAWWVDLLTGGERVAAIAAADFHTAPQRIGSPCTLVWAAERSERALLAGIRAGRTVLVNGPREARLELTADADGDGRHEALVGDTTTRKATFRVRVVAGKGLTLRLMRGREARLTRAVPADDWTVDVAGVGGLGAPFVYARLEGALATPRALTSAIYLR